MRRAQLLAVGSLCVTVTACGSTPSPVEKDALRGLRQRALAALSPEYAVAVRDFLISRRQP